MGDEERGAVARATGDAEVAGLDVLPLQCHLGCDRSPTPVRGARDGRGLFANRSHTPGRVGRAARRCAAHAPVRRERPPTTSTRALTWCTRRMTKYARGAAEVVIAAHQAGLTLTYLEEYLSMGFDPRAVDPSMAAPDRRYGLRLGTGRSNPQGHEPALSAPALSTRIATRRNATDQG